MPVSSITLTVSHIPSSISFYLAALQPLGYQYVGQWGSQIGLGADGEADFFLTQEVPGLPASTIHIAFDAPSRAAVHSFYAAALTAGGTPHGAPGARYGGNTCFNAAVLDFDGNSIEVVFHENSTASRHSSSEGASRGNVKALEWRDGNSRVDKNVNADEGSRGSVVSTRSYSSSASKVLRMPKSDQSQVSTKDVLATLQQSIVKGASSSSFLGNNTGNIAIAPKTLAGTLLGVAAGAAVAYAMCKSEEDSAKAEEQAAVLEAMKLRRSNLSEAKSPGGSRRTSVRKIEAPPETIPVGIETFMNATVAPSMTTSSRREMPVEYVPLIPSNTRSKSPTALFPRSAGHHTSKSIKDPVTKSASRAASAFERVINSQPRASPNSVTKSEAAAYRHGKISTSSSRRSRSKISERRKSSLPDISETEQLATSAVSHVGRKSKKPGHSHRSSSRHSSRLRIEESLAPTSSTEFLGRRSSEDDRDTVVPSDSISCVGSSSASHISRKTGSLVSKLMSKANNGEKKSKASSKHSSRHIDRHDDIRSEPPTRKSRRSGESSASDATITPKNYKERSVTSVPLRGIVPAYNPL